MSTSQSPPPLPPLILSWRFVDGVLSLLWILLFFFSFCSVLINSVPGFNLNNFVSTESIGQVVTIAFIVASVVRLGITHALHMWLLMMPVVYVAIASVLMVALTRARNVWIDSIMYTAFLFALLIPARAVWRLVRPVSHHQKRVIKKFFETKDG